MHPDQNGVVYAYLKSIVPDSSKTSEIFLFTNDLNRSGESMSDRTS